MTNKQILISNDSLIAKVVDLEAGISNYNVKIHAAIQAGAAHTEIQNLQDDKLKLELKLNKLLSNI